MCFGNKNQGIDSTLVDDIRAQCSSHGCLDVKNFSTYIKTLNTSLLPSGSGKSSSLKLTVPGKKLAEDLILRLRENNISDFFSAFKAKTRSKNKLQQSSDENKIKSKNQKPTGRPGPGEMLKTLTNKDFFNSPKTIDQIIKHCKEKLAFNYTAQEFSTSLTRATRSNLLSRTQNNDGNYEYTSIK